jgi:hypothetical protein
LIRHAGTFSPVFPLPVAMIELPFRTPLMTAVGLPPLFPPCGRAAGRAAIAVSAIAVLTDPENRPAPAANPMPQNHAVFRHVRPQAGLDNGDRSCQVRTFCCEVTC